MKYRQPNSPPKHFSLFNTRGNSHFYRSLGGIWCCLAESPSGEHVNLGILDLPDLNKGGAHEINLDKENVANGTTTKGRRKEKPLVREYIEATRTKYVEKNARENSFTHSEDISTLVPPSLTFIFLLDGEADFEIEQHKIQLNKVHQTRNCICILNHHEIVLRRLYKKGRASTVFMMVTLLDDELNDPLIQQGNDSLFELNQGVVINANELMTIASKLPRSSEFSYLSHAQFQHNLSTVMCQQLEHIPWANNRTTNQESSGTQAASLIKLTIDKVLTADKPDFKELHLYKLVNRLNMSVSKMQRLFKNEYRTTVAEYIRNARLKTAYNRLLTDNISIGEAAYLAGYRHTSNFSASFKQQFSMTPGEVQKQRGHTQEEDRETNSPL